MNYPLSESIKDYFLRQRKKTEQFISEINSQSMYYKQQISEVMFNLLDSHDTERILTTAKGNIRTRWSPGEGLSIAPPSEDPQSQERGLEEEGQEGLDS